MSRGCSGRRLAALRLRAARAAGRAAPALRAGACGRRGTAGWRRRGRRRARGHAASRGAALQRSRGCRAGRACRRPSSVSRAGSAIRRAIRTTACTTSPPTSIATKSRPAWPQAAQQRIGAAVARRGTRRRRPACSARPALQVAPERARRRVQVEVLRARARLAGDHLQHVGRDVLAGEHEQSRRQARRARSPASCRSAQVVVDAARAMRAAAADAAPQRGLPVVGALRRVACAPSRAASRGARPGISRSVSASALASDQALRGSRRRGEERRERRPAARCCSSRSTCQRRRVGVRRSARGARPRLASSARSTNSPGVRNSQVGADAAVVRPAPAAASAASRTAAPAPRPGRSQSPSAGTRATCSASKPASTSSALEW